MHFKSSAAPIWCSRPHPTARPSAAPSTCTYTVLLAREHPKLRIDACTPGFIETHITRRRYVRIEKGAAGYYFHFVDCAVTSPHVVVVRWSDVLGYIVIVVRWIAGTSPLPPSLLVLGDWSS